jgi:CDP-diacylglycerol--glycerol-3-phosphate 3-phosphatidyltransferase
LSFFNSIRWPNFLTWCRIVAIPLLVGVYFLPIDRNTANDWATALFVIAAITDAIDGWLARKLGQTSAFGAFLDPVADKLIVCAALVMLVNFDRVPAAIAVIIIGREITISALREWMAELGARKHVAVSSLGKFKTIAQLVAIPLLLFDAPLFGFHTRPVGLWLIYLAAVLTVWSMFYYLRQAWPLMRERV